ncbi:hypothetical protein BKA93DRAFT_507186 [Sparassis latifolia]
MSSLNSAPSGPSFVFIDDQSGAIQYAGDWAPSDYPSAVANNGTVTLGLAANASATYAFTVPDGEAMIIAVFGVVLPANASGTLPISSYTLDSASAVQYTPPLDAAHPKQVGFYESPPLPPGPHELVIEVEKVPDPDAYPYMLDELVVMEGAISRPPGAHGVSAGAIVGAVIGSVALLVNVLGLLGMFFYFRRRARRRDGARRRDEMGEHDEEKPFVPTPYTIGEDSPEREPIPPNSSGKRAIESPAPAPRSPEVRMWETPVASDPQVKDGAATHIVPHDMARSTGVVQPSGDCVLEVGPRERDGRAAAPVASGGGERRLSMSERRQGSSAPAEAPPVYSPR